VAFRTASVIRIESRPFSFQIEEECKMRVLPYERQYGSRWGQDLLVFKLRKIGKMRVWLSG
jgi:hypothetical protein